jgi:hypothetical protein
MNARKKTLPILVVSGTTQTIDLKKFSIGGFCHLGLGPGGARPPFLLTVFFAPFFAVFAAFLRFFAMPVSQPTEI